MSEVILTDEQVFHFDNSAPANQIAKIAKRVKDLESGELPAGSISTDELADGILAASVAGRAKIATGYFTEAAATDKFASNAISPSLLKEIPFHRTATLTSAAAATPVNILLTADVPAGKKVYLQGFIAKVDGATLWGTTATVKIQDNNGTPVDFVTIAVTALGANAVLVPGTADVTLEDAYSEGTGGTATKGLQIVGNAPGTGSDLKVTVWGVIK